MIIPCWALQEWPFQFQPKTTHQFLQKPPMNFCSSCFFNDKKLMQMVCVKKENSKCIFPINQNMLCRIKIYKRLNAYSNEAVVKEQTKSCRNCSERLAELCAHRLLHYSFHCRTAWAVEVLCQLCFSIVCNHH